MAVQATDEAGNAPKWLPNNAIAANHSPIAASSGWQANGDGGGMAWNAMDGNRSTVWDATVTIDAWFELKYN